MFERKDSCFKEPNSLYIMRDKKFKNYNLLKEELDKVFLGRNRDSFNLKYFTLDKNMEEWAMKLFTQEGYLISPYLFMQSFNKNKDAILYLTTKPNKKLIKILKELNYKYDVLIDTKE